MADTDDKRNSLLRRLAELNELERGPWNALNVLLALSVLLAGGAVLLFLAVLTR